MRREGRPHSVRLREVDGRLEVSFSSNPALVRPAVEAVVGACEREAEGGRRAGAALRVALGEAVANAIRHGSGGQPDRTVRIFAEVLDGEVRITVEDEGPGFDPEAVADPTAAERRHEPDGRGLFLMRSLMDEVRFAREGSAVTLVLRTAP